MALSFTAASFCFGETKKTEPMTSPAPVKAAPTTAPKKEASKMANPHMGKWKLNEAKSTLTAGMGKNLMVAYAEMKNGMKVTVDGVDKDGKKTHGVWMGSADGKAYPMKGNLPWDMAAYKVVNDHTYEITTMKAGKLVSKGKSMISADGKTRTLDLQGTAADGKKFKNKAIYDRA
ncbi:MAG: hypothetical protein DMF06_00345 [Verrucomicrobia bacterium]|nr:MAG: hypothetical protein DMF06_00345 [Verrucomicrobiota bacterium]